MAERGRELSTSGTSGSEAAIRLAQQPRVGKSRQLRRTRDQRALVLSAQAPEGAAQRRQGRFRQLRTVKQLRTVAPVQSDIIIIIKFSLARRMQPRQLSSLRSPMITLPRDIVVTRPKVDVARVAQVHQRAATKSTRPQVTT